MAAIKIDFKGVNRRQSDRYALDLEAFLISPQTENVETIDVSDHGIAFKTDVFLKKGNSYQMHVKVPNPLGPPENLFLPIRIQESTPMGVITRFSCMVEKRKMDESQLDIWESLLRFSKISIETTEDLNFGEIPIPKSGDFWAE